jgi:Recombination protein O N terminal/Recombination protein O C terminal
VEIEPDRRQRLYRVSALVLKRREMGEADRLLTVLTRDRGKLTLLAKGVRKPASRKAGHLEPFTHVELLVAKGKSLDLVTQAETLEAHRNLREDLWRSSWAYYVAELADAFIQDADPHELLFDLVLETLGRLDRGEEAALVVRYCELHLLSLSLPVLKVLRFLQSRGWEQVSHLRPSPETSRQVEAVLAQYIAYHLERGLRSPVFLLRLRQNLQSTDAVPAQSTDAVPAQSTDAVPAQSTDAVPVVSDGNP